jgi:hypothetical protein
VFLGSGIPMTTLAVLFDNLSGSRTLLGISQLLIQKIYTSGSKSSVFTLLLRHSELVLPQKQSFIFEILLLSGLQVDFPYNFGFSTSGDVGVALEMSRLFSPPPGSNSRVKSLGTVKRSLRNFKPK